MDTLELTTANKLFLLLIFLQIWMGGISLALFFASGFEDVKIIPFTLFLIMLVGYVVTFFAIFNDLPPFHLLVYPAAISNILLTVYPVDALNLSMSVLTLYFQIRHPIVVRHKTNFRSPKPKKRKRKSRKKGKN